MTVKCGVVKKMIGANGRDGMLGEKSEESDCLPNCPRTDGHEKDRYSGTFLKCLEVL